MRYRRYTVNAPPDLEEMIEERIKECPYNGASAYFLALAIFDCWSRREHKLTVKLMVLPPKVRDEAFAKIAEEFKKQTAAKKAGIADPTEAKPGWFDHFIKRIVEEEIKKAPHVSELEEKEKPKPTKRKRKRDEGDNS